MLRKNRWWHFNDVLLLWKVIWSSEDCRQRSKAKELCTTTAYTHTHARMLAHSLTHQLTTSLSHSIYKSELLGKGLHSPCAFWVIFKTLRLEVNGFIWWYAVFIVAANTEASALFSFRSHAAYPLLLNLSHVMFFVVLKCNFCRHIKFHL